MSKSDEGGRASEQRARRWREAAMELKPAAFSLGLPLVVFLDEAVAAAKFVKEHWEPELDPKTKEVRRPGLASAEKKNAGEATFTRSIADEILELHEEVQGARTRHLLAAKTEADSGAAMERATFLIGELSAPLEWLFDDGVEDENDAQLAAISSAHANDGDSRLERASLLSDFVALADAHKKELDGVLDFDAKYISEGRELVATLRGTGPEEKPASGDEDAARELDLRERLLRLLDARVKRVRKAARLVYRNAPETARSVASAYQRRSRAEQRRKAAAAANPSGGEKK